MNVLIVLHEPRERTLRCHAQIVEEIKESAIDPRPRMPLTAFPWDYVMYVRTILHTLIERLERDTPRQHIDIRRRNSIDNLIRDEPFERVIHGVELIETGYKYSIIPHSRPHLIELPAQCLHGRIRQAPDRI